MKTNTIDAISKIICESVKETLSASTNSEIQYAPVIQKISSVSLKPGVGCFVQFRGDYAGLFIMNISGEAALELYQCSMLFMGLSEDELAKEHTSSEVENYIGEIVNQLLGNIRKNVERQYNIAAYNNQPKALNIESSIQLSVATMLNKTQNRRLLFRTARNHHFSVEFSMEDIELISIAAHEKQESLDIDALLNEKQHDEAKLSGEKDTKVEEKPVDIDALLAEFG